MEKNIKDKILKCNLKSASGITLVALVVTLIVLLILAAVSLSAVFNQDGIFSRAEQATDKYGQAKARETLELCLSEAQMRKYESGLTEKQLDEEISKVGALIPKDEENSKYQLVIVEGHIFEIDRSVPKIVDYKGPADGIIITAQITHNGDWKNPKATVTGTITKYGGGTVVSSTATATEGVTITEFPTTGGGYTIPNIEKDTDITITASADDGKPAVTKTIKVRLVRDTTPPVIGNQSATANMMKITIKANATDNESGLASLTYKIEPNTIKDGKSEGTLVSGTPIEVEATVVGNYTVTFTAKDNAGNTTTAISGPVRATDAMSVADAKEKVNKTTLPDYIGTKVDYNPKAGGTWRIFYYDATGVFGDGEGTLYLKRDYDENKRMALTNYVKSKITENGLSMMKQLNLGWKKYENNESKKVSDTFLNHEKAAAGLCDTDNWTDYATGHGLEDITVKYAIGAPCIEMWINAYNIYIGKYEPSDMRVYCGMYSAKGYSKGYGWRLNAGSIYHFQEINIDESIEKSKVLTNREYQWISSPIYYGYDTVSALRSITVGHEDYTQSEGVCPVVCIPK